MHQVSPWTARMAGSGLGLVTLFAAALLGGPLRVLRRERMHVTLPGFFNVAAFSCSHLCVLLRRTGTQRSSVDFAADRRVTLR